MRRSVAILAAALILLAQSLGAIHSHRSSLTSDVKAQAELSGDSGLCALCLLAFHSPLNPAPAPAVARPQLAIQTIFTPVPHSRRAFALASSLTRAPPLGA